jgi:Zn-dependent protease
MTPLSFPFELIIAIIVGITAHEAAHAYIADSLGDPTPRYQGRVSLNPMVHLDVFGTIMIFLAGFGWGKPVEYNPRHFKNPQMGSLVVAIAGPLANLVCALIAALLLKFFGYGALERILDTILWLNCALFIFNLFPIPPLDGSKILAAFVPAQYDEELHSFFQMGPYILIFMILLSNIPRFDIFSKVLRPMVDGMAAIIKLAT